MHFNPNDLGVDNGNIFGLPSGYLDSQVLVLPVPWDVTVSYGDGTALSPERIREESMQVDLYDLDYGNFWEKGIHYLKYSAELYEQCKIARRYAIETIKLLGKGESISTNSIVQINTERVNSACAYMVDWVYSECLKQLNEGKKVVLLGGDHSTPLGYIKALAGLHDSFGILQIDAHCDLRRSYEGFEYSHASVMYNAIAIPQVYSLTQVGIRDFCQEEKELAENSDSPIHVFYDRNIQRNKILGKSWASIAEEIIKTLPQKVYVSFDIDGLNPAYCPNTGTPVLGGLEPDEVFYLLDLVKKSGREIIGMDLNEVGNDVWDANVGSRILYRMIGCWMSDIR